MIRLITISILFSILIFAGQVQSQTESFSEGSSEDSQKKAEESTENKDDIEDASLKIDVADVLQVDDKLEKAERKYEDLLNRIGLSDQKFSLFLSSIIIIAFFIILKIISNFSIHRFSHLALSHKNKLRLNRRRILFYASSIKWVISFILLLLCTYILMAQWDIKIGWLSESKILSLVSSMLSLLFVVLLAIVVIETVSGFIEGFFRAHDIKQSRVNTVKPIAKNITIGFLFFVFGMLALSQLGIDILPLLAGAGVVGIAIGFGAQALVKDVISGFIIILEDLIQVGDVVTLDGYTGLIERITIRKVQLRSLDGTVYTVSFGDVSTVANMTKLFSYYLMDIGIAYRENVDEVRDILTKISKEMRDDDEFKNLILEDIEILGLDQFADSAIIIKARIKTKPKQQWNVGREFNRRMKFAFDEQNIEIPFPHQTLYIGQDKEGSSPELNVAIHEKENIFNSDKTSKDESEVDN